MRGNMEALCAKSKFAPSQISHAQLSVHTSLSETKNENDEIEIMSQYAASNQSYRNDL